MCMLALVSNQHSDLSVHAAIEIVLEIVSGQAPKPLRV